MDSASEYTEKPFISHRQVVGDMVELASKKHQMKGTMEIDVTAAREKLRLHKVQTGETQSFTAWFVKCVAQAVSENKLIHGMRKGRKVILFDEVDVSVLVETVTGEESAALPYVVRSADKKSSKAIHAEIRSAQKQMTGGYSMVIGASSRLMAVYPHLPKAVRMLIGKIITGNPHHVKKNTGTVAVSSVGMMGRMNGWISPISPLPLSFAVCGITKKPGVVDDKIEIREMLNVAFAVDHDVVDGADTVRFLSRLNELMEEGFDL